MQERHGEGEEPRGISHLDALFCFWLSSSLGLLRGLQTLLTFAYQWLVLYVHA